MVVNLEFCSGENVIFAVVYRLPDESLFHVYSMECCMWWNFVYIVINWFLPRDAMQSEVMRQYNVVCPSVCLSVRP